MSANPLVSILIPAYNSEKWIKATINSVLAQTWKNTEIIIVDDGSKDNTYKIAKQFESGSVKVVTQNNKGASAARNKALSLSHGDFIQWLDSDDILAPNKIELQLKASEFNPSTEKLYSSAWGFFYFSLKRAEFLSNPLWQNLTPVEWLKYHLGEGYFMYPAVWLVSRKLTELAGPWDERLSYNDDGEYFCRVISLSEEIRFNPEAKSFHRVGNISSLSRSSDSGKAIKSYNLSLNLCVDYLLKLENNDATRKACINSLKKIIKKVYQNNSDIINSNQKRIIELGGSAIPVSNTKKFEIAGKIFGLRNARTLKIAFWNLEVLLHKYWDKLLSFLYRDAV